MDTASDRCDDVIGGAEIQPQVNDVTSTSDRPRASSMTSVYDNVVTHELTHQSTVTSGTPTSKAADGIVERRDDRTSYRRRKSSTVGDSRQSDNNNYDYDSTVRYCQPPVNKYACQHYVFRR